MGKRKKRNIQEKMKEETDKADKESKDDCKNMNNSKGTAEVIEKHKRVRNHMKRSVKSCKTFNQIKMKNQSQKTEISKLF